MLDRLSARKKLAFLTLLTLTLVYLPVFPAGAYEEWCTDAPMYKDEGPHSRISVSVSGVVYVNFAREKTAGGVPWVVPVYLLEDTDTDKEVKCFKLIDMELAKLVWVDEEGYAHYKCTLTPPPDIDLTKLIVVGPDWYGWTYAELKDVIPPQPTPTPTPPTPPAPPQLEMIVGGTIVAGFVVAGAYLLRR